MGSPVSPGDILELTKIIFKTYKKFRYASEEMDLLARKVRFVEVLMNDMNSKENQIEHLRKTATGRELAACLDDEMSAMEGTLYQIENITAEWARAQASWKAHRRVVFVLWTMRDIPDLRGALDVQMSHIQTIRQQASQAGQNLSAGAIKNLISELQKGGFVARKPSKKLDETEECKKAADALKNSGILTSDSAALTSKKEQELISFLKAQGIADNESQALVALYKKELQKQPTKPAVASPPTSPVPKPVTPKIENPHKTNEECQILVVGAQNGAFSIITQAYLELVRAWTVNTGGPWLFHRVDSAGLMISSGFRKGPGKLAGDGELRPPGKPCSEAAVQRLFREPSYFRTDDHPNEKANINNRILQHKKRGIFDDDFTRYDFILCFNDTLLNQLKRLSVLAQDEHPDKPNKAVILNIGGPDPYSDNEPHSKIVKEVRDGVKGFLRERFSWTRPPRAIDAGPYRTLFLGTPIREHKMLLQRKNRHLKQLESETKCQIRVAWQSKGNGWLISITGKQQALKDAEKRLVKFYADILSKKEDKGEWNLSNKDYPMLQKILAS